MKHYDIAAYIWPAYTGDEPRSRIFWEQGIGEWQSVKTAMAKYEGDTWPRKPLWGYQNEADPKVMEMQIDEAVKHGVNVFIYDWYWYDNRPFLENCLNDGFLKAANRSKMKFYLMWANHDSNYVWDKRLSDDFMDTMVWSGKVNREQFEVVVKRIISKYFSQPEYYKIDGCPVFMVYDLQNLMDGLGGVEQTQNALAWFREETKKAGFPGLHFQMVKWGDYPYNLSGVDGKKSSSAAELMNLLQVDSATHYQYAHFANIDQDYDEIMKTVVQEWEQVDKQTNGKYVPHISLGWDNNPRFHRFRNGIMKNNTPEAVERALRQVKAFLDARPSLLPMITINSWNEWTESSYLEPDDRFGYGYLEAVKKVFIDENT